MGTKEKILLTIVIGGFAAFSSPILFIKGLRQPLEIFYGIIYWGLPITVVLLVGISLFSTQGYKNVQSTGSALKKVADLILRLILIVTIAIAFLIAMFPYFDF